MSKQLISTGCVWRLPGDNALRKDGRQEREHKSEGQDRELGSSMAMSLRWEEMRSYWLQYAVVLNLPSLAFRRTVLATIFSISIVRMWISSSRDTFHSAEKTVFRSNAPTTVKLLQAHGVNTALAHSSSLIVFVVPLHCQMFCQSLPMEQYYQGLVSIHSLLPFLPASVPSSLPLLCTTDQREWEGSIYNQQQPHTHSHALTHSRALTLAYIHAFSRLEGGY